MNSGTYQFHERPHLWEFSGTDFNRYENTVENPHFWVLLRVTQSKFDSSLSCQNLMQQILRKLSLNHAKECVIIQIVILHPLCLSNSSVTGDVGHDAQSCLPMSNSAYAFVSILSSNLHCKHRLRPSAHPPHRCLDCHWPNWRFHYLLRRCLAICRPSRSCIDLL